MKDFREPNKFGIAGKQRPSRKSIQLFCQKKVKLKKMNMKIDNFLCKLRSPILRSSISVFNPSSIGICDVFFSENSIRTKYNPLLYPTDQIKLFSNNLRGFDFIKVKFVVLLALYNTPCFINWAKPSGNVSYNWTIKQKWIQSKQN